MHTLADYPQPPSSTNRPGKYFYALKCRLAYASAGSDGSFFRAGSNRSGFGGTHTGIESPRMVLKRRRK